ncbi:40S ribosomal protein S5 [Tetrabaena socialis]|uniref:40S ribosomal protein S5 n=1 Tax=Tetrabaena socialis TaxID=47790 RepID=A0A2J8A373_9CHLO|nr:40S ribosomal protein S5 [Tetrabaena socialis]|eukprot:PNH06964.1 40S ribosomal protein S5 [Tetrabaena socialis]
MATPDVKLFGKWSFEDIEVQDISLEDYIAVKTKYAVYVPHTAGRYQKKRFRKALCPIVESGPREDATRIGSAGVVRRQAVDISPLRRVNSAIYLLTTGAREAAFRNIKTIAECLADELVNAAKGSSNSYAIKKKDELERVAKANR